MNNAFTRAVNGGNLNKFAILTGWRQNGLKLLASKLPSLSTALTGGCSRSSPTGAFAKGIPGVNGGWIRERITLGRSSGHTSEEILLQPGNVSAD